MEAATAIGVMIIQPVKTPFRDLVKPMHEAYEGTSIDEVLHAIKTIP
ncbi:hypothetical protein GCM10027217_14850 [Pseudomaricurvus hydrocarbonicus]